jgi:hypothetical protein
MALQKHFTTAHGFTASAAYARITSFSGNKHTIQVNVDVHKDAQARTDEKQPIEQFSISLPLALGATMEQMYTALKLDSNFTDAIDC